MTGIPKLVERADFASRTVYVELPAIPESQRLTEAECEREVHRPLAAGIGLSARGGGSDPCRRGCAAGAPAAHGGFQRVDGACHPHWAGTREKFTEAYTANRALAAVDVVEADPIGPAIIELVDVQPAKERDDGRLTQRWEGSATQLIEALPVPNQSRKQKSFPHPNTLPAHLRRNSLAAQGIEMTLGSENREPDKKRTKTIVIERLKTATSL